MKQPVQAVLVPGRNLPAMWRRKRRAPSTRAESWAIRSRTRFGAVLDNPDLIATVRGRRWRGGDRSAGDGVACLISFSSAKHDGAVLPILHLNGYKISNPTVFVANLTDEERRSGSLRAAAGSLM